jgi:agmatinase
MAEHDPDAPVRAGAGIFGLDSDEASARVVLVPVPFEATVSYGPGAARGPGEILRGSWQVDLFDLETGRPYEAGIFMRREAEEIIELNARAKRDREVALGRSPAAEEARTRVDEASGLVNDYVHAVARELLAGDKIVGVIGGDHSVAFGSIAAHADKYGGIGILHLDAHADLRASYEGFEFSHASIMECCMRRIPGVKRLVQIGVRDVGRAELDTIKASAGRISTWVDPLIVRARLAGRLLDLFAEAVDHLPEQVYVSFDIDGLDPRLCPGTGTPVPGGLDLGEASLLLQALVESGRTIVGFDLVEVAQGDDRGDWNGNVGARLLYKLIGWTLLSRTKDGFDHRSLWEQLRHKNATARIIA